MSANEKFYGNFYFMEDGFIFMYGTESTDEPLRELERMGCSLPHFQVLSMSYHDSFTDYGYSSLVRFTQIIGHDYYESVKSAITGKQRYKFEESNNLISIQKIPEAELNKEDFLYISFWIGNDGKQYANMSWGKI